MFIFEEPTIQEDEDRLDEMLEEHEYNKVIKEASHEL
jgi:hypothetical protein